MARIFWIPGTPPPPLAILLCPRGGRELSDELREFKREGVQTLISLLEHGQVDELDLVDEDRLASSVGMRFIHHPMPDHSLPPDEAAFEEFVGGLAHRMRDGESIGVHCWGSIGRATVVAACALIHLGWEAWAALAAIETARGCPVPDTAEQKRWILNYKPGASNKVPNHRTAPAAEPIAASANGPIEDFTFPRAWKATILADTPTTLPARQFIYPSDVEEVESGALEVQVRPSTKDVLPFLATCALGFRDPAVPTGIWSCPKREEICAVSGGYAYVINTATPENFTMIPYRPVMEIRALESMGLLLFISHYEILAWGVDGYGWESEKLSDEGLRITDITGGILHGMGWNRKTDRETPFALELLTGVRIPARE